MDVRTHLLAVKPFRPNPSLGSVTDKVVTVWLRQVMGQHGVADSDVGAAVTDAGADARRGVILAYDWEWCIAHLLNRATIDGTGMSTAKALSKNVLCRALMEDIKRMAEHFNESPGDKVWFKS